MSSGWDPSTKKVIRNNGRNVGPTIWDEDAIAGQVIDSQGHDTNDQTLADSISDTLNINGINSMLAPFGMGGFKIFNLGPGSAATDSVNKGQMDAADSALQSQIDDLDTAVEGVPTSQSFNGVTLTTVRAAGNFATAINVFTALKPNGPITHKLTNSTTIDVSAANRWAVSNNSNITITFTGLPSGDVSPYGSTYQVEGQVIVWNGTTPGTVTIAGATGARVLGEPSAVADSVGVLSYMIQRVSGTNRITLIWSAI